MREDGEARFREPKTINEERELVKKAIPSSTKYKNKWAVTIFGDWQFSRSVIAKAQTTPFLLSKSLLQLSTPVGQIKNKHIIAIFQAFIQNALGLDGWKRM